MQGQKGKISELLYSYVQTIRYWRGKLNNRELIKVNNKRIFNRNLENVFSIHSREPSPI